SRRGTDFEAVTDAVTTVVKVPSVKGDKMSVELFRRLAAIEMTHVPDRGAGPALNNVIPSRIDVFFGTMPSTLPLVHKSHFANPTLSEVSKRGVYRNGE